MRFLGTLFVIALRDAASRSSVDDFRTIWSRNAELALFRAYSKAGGPIVAGSSTFLGRGLSRIRGRRLGGRAVGHSGVSRRHLELFIVMKFMFVLLSTLLTPLLLRYSSFAGVSSLLLMS